MSYLSKIKKLRRMPVDEMRCRLSKVLNRSRERKRWRTRSSRQGLGSPAEVPHDWLSHMVRLVPGADPAQLRRLREICPAYAQRMSQRAHTRATAIRSGRWPLLNHPYDLTGEISWHSDPRTGYRWPRQFYGDLPLYDLPGQTDVKYPWELSRHQFLCELARDYQLNGNRDSAQRVQELLVDWIDENPLYEGINWTSGLEVAMRAISWTWTLAGLATWDGWEPETLRKVAASLWDHGIYLADNFSYYSSPYNHLIGEATGLLLIASLFDENPTTRAWDQQARETLRDAAPTQFYQDHFCVEQAVGYHYYTLGFLTQAWCTARASGRPLDELTPMIRQAFLTGATFRRPDGTWPAVGDLDSARALPVFPEHDWSFDGLHQLAAVLLDDAQLKLLGDQPGEELYWLAGTDGAERWQQMPAAVRSPVGGHVHRDSGYVVASDGQDWMLFDAGPIAGGLFADATPSTAHGHADMLQVLYHTGGEAVLDDSGMPFYGGDPDWVRYFRGPAAHNTVQIEQTDFVRHAGRLAWSHEIQRPTLTASFTDAVWLCGARVHWPGVSHERQVCCLPGRGLWVADLIVTDRPRRAQWYWQLPATAESLTPRVISFGGKTLSSTASHGSGTSKLSEALATSPEGWRCHGYGQRAAGKRLLVQHEVRDSLLVLTSVGAADRPPLAVDLGGIQVTETGSLTGGEGHDAELGQCRWHLPVAASSPARPTRLAPASHE